MTAPATVSQAPAASLAPPGKTGRDEVDASNERSLRRLARFRTLADFRAGARHRLPRMVFDYIEGGAGTEATIRANRAALDRVKLIPSAPADVSRRSLGVELFGQRLAMPVIIGPTGLASASWPRGELALARAAARFGIPFTLSNAASVAPEDVVRAAGGGPVWFQLYPPPDRDTARAWVEHVRTAGFSALQVTVDVAVPGNRLRDARNAFAMPFRWSPRKMLDVALHPHWAMQMLQHGAPRPYLAMQGVGAPPRKAATHSDDRRHRFSSALSWDNLRWLRDAWRGPLMVKGLMDPRQARQAIAAGYDGIVISNHGGRQLDGAAASLDMLPAFREEVGTQLPLLIDGGFQSGPDVLKALALGAAAVQLGRGPIYALATAGEAGVAAALRLLRDDIDNAMALCGITDPQQLDPCWISDR